jgi:DNA polymerase-1
VDAMNYIFRAYYGLPPTITAPSGMKTNAVFGYLRTLLRIIREQDPPYIAAAFEGAHSFRRKLYSGYKANREAPPDDLKAQFAYCRQLTEAIGIHAIEVETYEADDVIGSIALRMADRGHPVVIVSGDKDLAQLVDDRIRIYDLAQNLWLDEAGVRKKLGVDPEQVPDLLALLGDAADNIPGIPGVGGKTATKLLSVCRKVEDIPGSNFDGLPFRGRDTILRHIRENLASVLASRELTRLRCDIEMDVTPDTLRYRRGSPDAVIPLCRELGIGQILDDIPLRYDQPGLFD